MDLAGRIRTEREARQMSQEALARQAGMSLRALNSLERGEAVNPHYSTLVGIADAFGMSIGELLEEPVPLGEDLEAGQINKSMYERLWTRVAAVQSLGLSPEELQARQQKIKERLPELKRKVPFGKGYKEEITNETEYYDLVDDYYATGIVLVLGSLTPDLVGGPVDR